MKTSQQVILEKLVELFPGYDFSGPDVQVNVEFMDPNKMHMICTIQVDPSTLGLASLIFTEMSVDIRAGFADYPDGSATRKIELQDSWAHPRGSNGYSQTFCMSDGVVWNKW